MNDDGRQSERQQAAAAAYMRLPAPLVVLALVVVLGAALAVGLYANNNLRQPRVEIPTAVAAPAVISTPTPLPPATSTPPPAPTASPTTAPVAISTPQATVQVTSAPTAAAVSVTQATATVPPTPLATVEPALAAEIGDAYQNYWRVRAEAVYFLDSSHLEEVMAGDHLSATQEAIAQLQSEGRAIDTEVSHSYVVVEATDSEAKVADSYTDNSVYVNSDDHTPLTTPTGERLTELYVMSKIDGSWRVTDLVRSP